MKHDKKTKEQLESELARLRERVAELERSDGDYKRMKEAYRAMAEQSLQGLVIIQDSRVVFANTAFAEISGYTLEELPSLSPEEVRALIHPEDQELAWGRFRDRLEGKHVPHRYEYRGIRKDGTMRWLEMMASRVKYRGEPAIQGAIIDITEHKDAEEKLKHEKKHLESLIQYSSLAIVTLDERHTVISCNRDFDRLFQYEESEIVGKNLDKVIAGQEYRQDAMSYTKETLDGKAIHGSGTRERKDGSPIEVEFFGVPVVIEEKVVGAYGIYRDITERKRMEEALRESEERYRSILESIQEGYFEVDLAGNFTFFNNALCKITGYSRDVLMGMNNREYTSPETANRMYQIFNQVYRTGKPSSVTAYEIISIDGQKQVLEMSASLMCNAQGEPIGFRGLVRDITERERMEEQLQLAQKMEALGTLAGGIAHNFNNLLTGIMGNASLVLMDIEPIHPHYGRLKSIEKLVEGGSKLTKQLLGYARKGFYEIKPISVNRIVEETCDAFETTKKEISVHRELAEDLSGIKADQGQIEQVLWNLYINAADAMPEGGELFLKTMNTADKDMVGKPYRPKPGNYVLIRVRDTGVGMDQKTMERIFDPFFTTKELGTGTGLGLASVYGIIKAHRGYIDVESREAEGTTFEIYLPALGIKSEEIPQGAGHIVTGNETILLVDDEPTILQVGSAVLQEIGYTVFKAEGGREALEVYEKKGDSIDLVILDMIMPDMGGSETYDRLKDINPKIHVLLSSGYSIDGQAKEILDRGCDAFIQKPFSIRELSGRIREILDKG